MAIPFLLYPVAVIATVVLIIANLVIGISLIYSGIKIGRAGGGREGIVRIGAGCLVLMALVFPTLPKGTGFKSGVWTALAAMAKWSGVVLIYFGATTGERWKELRGKIYIAIGALLWVAGACYTVAALASNSH